LSDADFEYALMDSGNVLSFSSRTAELDAAMVVCDGYQQ
jgi:hypothetical protein